MPGIPPELKQQIERAFDYRGHVTVRFKTGESVEGYLFNRQHENAKWSGAPFIDLFLKNKDEKKRYPMSAIESVALTGEDCAAGKSYEDHLAKQKRDKQRS